MGKGVIVVAIIVLFVIAVALAVWFIIIFQDSRRCTNEPSVFCADVICPDGTKAVSQDPPIE